MKNFSVFLLLTLSIISGCNSEKMTPEIINEEKDKIRTRIESFLSAYANKDLNAILSMLSFSKDFHFLGSDISEISKSNADFQEQLISDWKLFDSISFSEIRNSSIQISESGDIAVTIFDAPIIVVVKENQRKFIFRMAITFIKENNLWKMVQGMASIPSIGESSVELIQKLR